MAMSIYIYNYIYSFLSINTQQNIYSKHNSMLVHTHFPFCCMF